MATIQPNDSPAQAVRRADLGPTNHRLLDLEIRLAEIERELPVLIADCYDFDGRFIGDVDAVLRLQHERRTIVLTLEALGVIL